MAVSLATNYALLSLPNVKLMDVCVFIAGMHLGLSWGLVVGASTWLFYGLLNPYGISPFTTAVVIIGESFYAIAGWALANLRASWNSAGGRGPTLYAVAGLLSTLSYDLFTNALVGLVFYGSALMGLITMNFPLPLALIHEASNFLIFPLIALPIEGRLTDLLGKRPERKPLSLPHLEHGLIVLASLSILMNAFFIPSYFSLQEENAKLSGLLRENTASVNLLFNFGNGTRKWYNGTMVPAGSSLFNATRKVFGAEVIATFSPYGVSVDEIAGVGPSSDRPAHYWMWYRWDSEMNKWVLGETSADQYKLSPGESVAWAFVDTSSWPSLPEP